MVRSQVTRLVLAVGTAAAVIAAVPVLAQTNGPDVLPLSARGQPVPGFPDGPPASPPEQLKLEADDIARLKAGKFKAAIAMQALDTPWNSLQVESITATLEQFGIPVIAVTDAAQNPGRQNAQLANLIARKPDVIFSVPIDPSTQTEAYKAVTRAGIKLVFMDNVVKDMAPGEDYVTVVASDNESGATFASRQLVAALGGKGDVGLITYSYDSYYSVAVRRKAFERVVADQPGVRLVASERFTQPSEVYAKTIAMLRAHPTIKGIFAVWADPAMQAHSAAKSMGRSDIVITTNDLGPDSAIYVARGDLLAIGAQLPYDLGIAEAKAGALALLRKPVPPYIALPALGVTKGNLLPSLEQVTKRPPPAAVEQLCAGGCGKRNP